MTPTMMKACCQPWRAPMMPPSARPETPPRIMPGGEHGLRHGAVAAGEGIGNQGLRGGGISGFADTDKSAGDEEEEKGGSEAAGNGGETPEEHAAAMIFGSLKRSAEVARGDTGERQYHGEAPSEGNQAARRWTPKC